MTPRLVMGLGIAALVSAGAAGAVWQAGHVSPVTADAGDWLLPGLAENVNTVSGIAVSEAATTIRLERKEAGWTVQPSGYPVKSVKLQKVLVGLVRMTKLEPRTASAEKHAVINVDQPGQAGSKARQVTLNDAKGDVIGDVILGKATAGYTSGAEEAQYVRLADEAQSWLVKGAVNAGAALKDWVDTTVMRIKTGSVKQVRLTHSDGEVLTLVRAGKDDKGNDRYEVQSLPDGVTPKDDLTVRYAATDLANVEFTDVRKATSTADPVSRVQLETETGLKVAYELMQEGDQAWLKVKVVEKGSDTAQADKIAERINGWEFGIADYKAKQFKKRLKDLLGGQQ